MLKFVAAILASCLSYQAFGCDVPVTPLNQGDKAPCTGYLFSPEQEQKLRIQNEDYKALQEEVKIYLQEKETFQKELDTTQQIADKEQQKAELWRKAAEDSTAKYVQQEQDRTTRDYLFLLAGIGLTVLAGWTVGQVAKH